MGCSVRFGDNGTVITRTCPHRCNLPRELAIRATEHAACLCRVRIRFKNKTMRLFTASRGRLRSTSSTSGQSPTACMEKSPENDGRGSQKLEKLFSNVSASATSLAHPCNTVVLHLAPYAFHTPREINTVTCAHNSHNLFGQHKSKTPAMNQSSVMASSLSWI